MRSACVRGGRPVERPAIEPKHGIAPESRCNSARHDFMPLIVVGSVQRPGSAQRLCPGDSGAGQSGLIVSANTSTTEQARYRS